MRNANAYDDSDDDADAIDAGEDKNAYDLLAQAAFDAALTRKMRAQLERHPSLIIIVAVPNAEWVPFMC